MLCEPKKISKEKPWSYLGPTLVLSWSYLDPTLILPWSYLGPTLVLPWSYLGPTLVLPWSYFGPTLILPWSYLDPTLVLSGERGQAPSLCRSMSSSWLLQQPEKYVLYFYILLFIFNFSFYIYVHVLLLFRIYIFCFTSACLAETISPLLLNSPESTVLKNKKKYLHHGLQNKIKIKMSWSTYKLQPAVRVEKCDHRSRELVVRGDKKATTLEGFQIRVCFLIKTKI